MIIIRSDLGKEFVYTVICKSKQMCFNFKEKTDYYDDLEIRAYYWMNDHELNVCKVSGDVRFSERDFICMKGLCIENNREIDD